MAQTASSPSFLDLVRDFSSLPMVAVQQQPDRVCEFLEQIGGIQVLFGALAAPVTDDDVRDAIVRSFRAVLSVSPGRAALAAYPSLSHDLLNGLRHPDEFVRQIAAEQLLGLYSGAGDSDSDGIRARLRAVLADDVVFGGVLDAIADPSTSVAETVAQFIVTVADVERFFGTGTCAHLRRLAHADPVVLVRVLVLASRVANLSGDAFARFQRSGLLDDVLAQVVGDGAERDPLLQMSMFTVLAEVSRSAAGLRYLIQVPLGALLRRFAPGTVDSFVTCAALQLVESISDSSLKLACFDWIPDPDLRVFLTAAIDSDDDAVLEAAIGALAATGRCYSGLCEFTRVQNDLLLRLVRIAIRPALSTNALIMAVLHGLATVFAARYDEIVPQERVQADVLRRAMLRGTLDVDRAAEGLNLTRAFMAKISKWLVNVENDLRIAVYRFLAELARYRFGLDAIICNPGVIETLLDRHNEHDAKANLWRFTVVQALGANPSLDAAWAGMPNLATRVHEHVHEGPYHKGTSIDVAVL